MTPIDEVLTIDAIGGGSTLREIGTSGSVPGDSVRLKTPGGVVCDADEGEALFRVVGDSARLHVDVLTGGGTRFYAEAQAVTVGLRYGKLEVHGVPRNYRLGVHGKQ